MFPPMADVATSFDWTPVVSAVVAATLSAVGWLTRNYVKNKRAGQAIKIVAQAASAGVAAAWVTYTQEIKASRADGKLTDEEKAEARKKAFSAALESLGENGKKLVQSVFKDGLNAALENAIEADYATFRQNIEAKKAEPAANPQ